MPKSDGSLGSLVQGVSQQPTRARRPGQALAQLNIVNDEVRGLSRRPPVHFLSDTGRNIDMTTNSFGFTTSGAGEALWWVLEGEEITLFRLTDGTVVGSHTVPDSYLLSAPANDVELRTVENDIMILNKDKIIAADTTLSPAAQTAALVYMRGVASGTEYGVDIVDSTGTYTVRAVTSKTDATNVNTRKVVEALYTLLTTGLGPGGGTFDSVTFTGVLATLNANYTFTLIDGHLLIDPTGAQTDVNITPLDTTGQQTIFAITDTIDDAGLLPARAAQGQLVKVTGQADEQVDDYYLQWSVDGVADGVLENKDGVWEETTAPGQTFKLDATTMPYIFSESGGWTVGQFPWTDRSAGDEDTNPMPAFVGGKIKGISEFQARLLFAHDRDVSMSQTDDYGNFFFQSATVLTDDDTIHEFSTAGNNNPQMHSLVTFGRDLVLFAEPDTQYTISGRVKVTPTTAAVMLSSTFDANLAMGHPVTVGSNMFYLNDVGRSAELNELFLSADQEEVYDKRSVSGHVNKYVPNTVTRFIADDSLGMSVAWAPGFPTTLHIYEYLWQDGKKVQSAWSKWEFPLQIFDMAFVGSRMYIVCGRDTVSTVGSLQIMYMDFAREESGTLGFEVHLDLQRAVSTNTPTLPDPGTGLEYVAVYGGSTDLSGKVAPMELTTDLGDTALYTITQAGADDYHIGVRYETRYTPTMPLVRDSQGVAREVTKLSIGKFLIHVEDSGPFTMTRESPHETVEDYWSDTWTAMIFGDPNFDINSFNPTDDVVEFTFEEQADVGQLVIETDSHAPLNITEIEWRGFTRGVSTRINTGG